MGFVSTVAVAEPGAMRVWPAAAIAVACAVGLWLNLQLVWGAGKNGMDFNQFYAASRLAGTGHLYDWDALRTLEAPNGPPIHSGRLPVVSYGVKAISWMPFRAALLVWQMAGVAALLAVCAIWPGVSRVGMVAAMAWSAPAVYLVSLGQDVAFWLLFCAGGLALLHRYPRLAGVAFALCLCKYHLALGLPVMLAAQKRWKALAAGRGRPQPCWRRASPWKGSGGRARICELSRARIFRRERGACRTSTGSRRGWAAALQR